MFRTTSSKSSKEDDYHFFVVYCSDILPPLDDTHMYGDDICEILSFNSSESVSDLMNDRKCMNDFMCSPVSTITSFLE